MLGLVRELLENAAKHAGASRVWVRVSRQGGDRARAWWRTTAWGSRRTAWTPPWPRATSAWPTARERVRALDGALAVETSRTGGARVEAVLPYRRPEGDPI